MNLVVVGLLIGLWAWVLLPGLLRERRRASEPDTDTDISAGHSIDSEAAPGAARRFADRSGRQILVLGDPERVVSSRTRSHAEVRRRVMLARGGFGIIVAAVVGLLLGGWWWTPAAAAGVTYLAYVALVARLERRLAEQREMLHDLGEERRRREPPTFPDRDPTAIEVAVGDASGIIVTGWQEHQSRGN